MESFRSSDAYDDEAHQLYDEGRYDEALVLLQEGLQHYPDSVELHVGHGYARLARHEFAWARHAFLAALSLDPDHEDALTGHGEVLLVLGRTEAALALFQKVIQLGFYDDIELMLQIGRALYHNGYFAEARRFFDLARTHNPYSVDAVVWMGSTSWRLGLDAEAIYWLRRALEMDPECSDARIQLATLLLDLGRKEAALYHFELTDPAHHTDEDGPWRAIMLLVELRGLEPTDPALVRWNDRLGELGAFTADPLEILIQDLEFEFQNDHESDPRQLELFATMMRDLPAMQQSPAMDGNRHLMETLRGHSLHGTWDELLGQLQMMDGAWADNTLTEFMAVMARRALQETGVEIPTTTAEAFLRGAAEAGLVRVIR